jgi:hypothetical protein
MSCRDALRPRNGQHARKCNSEPNTPCGSVFYKPKPILKVNLFCFSLSGLAYLLTGSTQWQFAGLSERKPASPWHDKAGHAVLRLHRCTINSTLCESK